MLERPWYKAYARDFLTGTAALPLEARGAYRTILDLIYDRGGPVPDDPRWLAGWCGCSVRKWLSLRQVLLADPKKLVDIGGHLMNPRAAIELENAAKTSRKQAENGAKSARAKREKQPGVSNNSDLGAATLQPHARDRVQSSESEKKDSPTVAEVVSQPHQPTGLLPLGDEPASAAATLTPRDLLWARIPVVQRLSRKPEQSCRQLLGRWCSQTHNAYDDLLAAIDRAQREPPLEFVPWMERVVAAIKHERGRPGSTPVLMPENLDPNSQEGLRLRMGGGQVL